MQKLYKVAFQRILTKIGADKIQKLNVQALQTLLKQKNVPLEHIDENIFHKLPRQEVKNLLRNPCPVNKAEQTSSEIVTNAKAVRAAFNIVEKKICFKCPFVSTCDKAFIEPQPNYVLQNPLQNLLISMKNISELENSEKTKNRSWFSGVRVSDSLNSVVDDLLQGGDQFKIFKTERNLLKQEAESERQKKQQLDEDQLIKLAKKNKVPLKDVYAQVPNTKKDQNTTQKQGEQAFEELTKGPENIFKKKKNEQFIKLAQKYLNEDNQPGKKNKNIDFETQYEEKVQKKTQTANKKQFRSNEVKNTQRPYKREFQRENQREFSRVSQRGSRVSQRGFEREGPRETQRGNERRFETRNPREGDRQLNRDNRRENYRDNRRGQQYDRKDNYREKRNTNRWDREQNANNLQKDFKRGERNYNQERQKNQRDEEEFNPKIRRLSKERPNKTQTNFSEDRDNAQKKGSKLDKFYSSIRDQTNDQEQILTSFNKRETQPRSSKLPRDAKYNQGEGNTRENSGREFSERELKQFDRLEKVPKILKTQFASKQDIQQRAKQEASAEEGAGERKGRRVKRS